MRSTPILLTLALLLVAAAALGQPAPGTTNLDSMRVELCARDSLYIVSPEVFEFALTEGEDDRPFGLANDDVALPFRFGMLLRWRDLPLEESTCFALRGTDTLDIDVEAAGGFGDRVDRVLRFTVDGEGTVGADQPGHLVLVWRNEGESLYGNLEGYINLANNGGVQVWNEAGLDWDRRNVGLALSWRQVNTLDMAIANDRTMYAAFSADQTVNQLPRGLYRNDGPGWTRLDETTITDEMLVTVVAVAPDNSGRVAVGTERDGLFLSTDGGESFTQWYPGPGDTDLIDPENPPETFYVNALDWTGTRLLVAVRSLGLFASQDNGVGWTEVDLLVPDDLDKQNPTPILPQINSLTIDPGNPQRVLVSLQFHGCYESNDGGVTWHDLYGDLLVPVDGDNGAWVRSALSVAVDSGNPQTLVMAVEQWGLYQTTNGGVNWSLVAENVQPEPGLLRKMKVIFEPTGAGRFLAMENEWSLLESTDGGATWDHFADQPTLSTALTIAVARGGDNGNFGVGTWGGGLYVPGTPIALSDTYSTGTTDFLRDLDLGLDLQVNSGNLSDNKSDPTRDDPDSFDLVGQTFQGWGVWRSLADNPDTMTMIGKFDRVNPEACIIGFCGLTNYQPLPNCFHTTRAACFAFDGEYWYFFDNEIYNAFRYHYAVSTFDYANTAAVAPENMARTMIVSPRWPNREEADEGLWRDDPVSIFSGPPYWGVGNRQYKQVDRAQSASREDGGIYVFPNPLRNDAGIPGEEGRTVIFTNLPEESRVRVFTTAGDDVADLGPENLSGGQIRWETVNREQESVAAGVYLFKVEVPGRADHWGRLVIIR